MHKAFILIVTILLFLGHIYAQDEVPFSDCPKSPNCVSTIAAKRSKRMKTLQFTCDLNCSKELLKKLVLAEMKGSQLVSDSSNSLHFIVTTNVGSFIDDVAFYLDETKQVVHFKSSSREGWSDFGANKRRMRRFRRVWERTENE